VEDEETAGYILDLNQFCIETTARREYQRLMDLILDEADSGPDLEKSLELLRIFLEQEDFPAIRSAYPELAGGTDIKVRLFRDQTGKVQWRKL
jgi:hypothetical protein